ncbi:kinase-like domain-containing protein [Desarmillaria tabescens]|uniref:non-specific serine/threonine protein kinase n=1 Tax=Armillaria tabescens TaxID=1929756 RepID=A0AA39JZ93_ARMTA|nr:kinase-like domain-containing protein [Desarmillaria tabescens]KAK0451392.1 kinase-like domain-containing protein [Desarmillaria tabescens]
MSLSWIKRKSRLQELLKSHGDEEEDGLALDRLLHGQSVIGKTSRTIEIDSIKLQDKDFQVVGKLDYGQFGVIDVVKCRLDGRVYVRKTIEKKFVLRAREQCSPQLERDILRLATTTKSQWVPHLLCAFQTPTHLKLVMDYAEGGTLWDVLESSALDGRISERDIRWWAPQIVSAIHWCHSQGFVHRDIKPHNFVLKTNARILLIDFGSAAPLLPRMPDGSQRLPKQHCLVPCGTCDYISPEILKAHERALVALEMEDDDRSSEFEHEDDVYGRETDWWSMGVMLYEMAYGQAPFFAEDIRRTYAKIMADNRYIPFNNNIIISPEFQDFLRKLLTDAEFRLGRHSVAELTSHKFFANVRWTGLHEETVPADIHVPQFIYSDPNAVLEMEDDGLDGSGSESKLFAFSDLFQSSAGSSQGLSILKSIATPQATSGDNSSAFIGFSWGPMTTAFPDIIPLPCEPIVGTPKLLGLSHATIGSTPTPHLLTPTLNSHHFSTPIRSGPRTPYQTLSRNSTARRTTVTRRPVSDREAMKQLIDCVGMSAHKKVLESGRKPHILTSIGRHSRSASLKELRFLPLEDQRKLPVNASDSEEDSDSDMEAPPSPSPSPRPGSVMSKRSATPNATVTFTQRSSDSSSQRTGTDSSVKAAETPQRGGEDVSTSRLRMGSSLSYENTTFDGLESKHALIMEDIHGIEGRLKQLVSAIAK